MLDRLAGDRERLHALLGLPDTALIDALAGRRREALRQNHAALAAAPAAAPGGAVDAICRHDPAYPTTLCDDDALPWMLHVAGGAARLARLAARPIVALLGSLRASDYGRELARTLAAGLTASGVTVASSLADGIGAAAQAGAQDANGGGLAVLDAGLGLPPPTRWRALYGQLTRSGCALAELPPECPGRRWGHPAGERTVTGLATLVVVVEARETARELAAAHRARELGRPLAVLPGRVTSPLSAGPHALLLEGASPIRHVEDVLELLSHSHHPRVCARVPACGRVLELEPRLHAILELVGSGHDTPDRLLAAGAEPSGLLLGLTELELQGLLARGENGRYLPRHASACNYEGSG